MYLLTTSVVLLGHSDSDQGQASETEDIYGRIEMERNPCYVEL